MSALLLAALLCGAAQDMNARDMQARGVPPERVVVAFASTPAIDAFAEPHAQAKDPARALYEALLALKKRGAIVGDLDNSPKARRPKTAGELFAAASDARASDRAAGCYELTALYVAAARSIGVPAGGAELEQPTGSGQVGHVLALVPRAGGPLVVDLQNERTWASGAVRPMGDLELAAHHYNHASVARYLAGDLRGALRAIDDALKLAPDNPSFLNNRAGVLAGEGELAQAIAEVSHAARLAPRLPIYRYQLGRLTLASGAPAAALPHFEAALRLRGNFGLALRDRAWALMLTGAREQALAELRRALEREPELPDGALYLGLAHLAARDAAAALVVVEQGLRRTPDDQQLLALQALARDPRGASGAAVERLRRVLATVPVRGE